MKNSKNSVSYKTVIKNKQLGEFLSREEENEEETE